MPRRKPGPLPSISVIGHPRVTGRQTRLLTPRTPHSTAGRAEEGFTELELQNYQDEDSQEFRSQLQKPPLLPSGYRSQGDAQDVRIRAKAGQRISSLEVEYWSRLLWRKLPVIGGVAVAATLLIYAFSINRPESLEAFLPSMSTEGSNTPHSMTTPTSSRPFISYENYTQFPLKGDEYRAECEKLADHMHGTGFWDEPTIGPIDVRHSEEDTGPAEGGRSTKVCSNTITYMLDGHVGLTADLAFVAQAAAFARERNRTFLVHDTYWNRGKWTDYFRDVRTTQPGPEPDCHPPPPEELVACPRTARHWVLSSRTAKFHLGGAFAGQYEIQHAQSVYERARASLEQTILPNARSAALIHGAREEILSTLSVHSLPQDLDSSESARVGDEPVPSTQALYIGVHIHRGERTLGMSEHRDSKDDTIPVEKFVEGARSTWDMFFGNTSSHNPSTRDVSSGRPDHYPAPPIMWLASDSLAAARDFVSRFSPATAVFSLEHSTKPELRGLAPEREYVQAEFDAESLEERVRLTRGMIVDFAMLSGLWASSGHAVPEVYVAGA